MGVGSHQGNQNKNMKRTKGTNPVAFAYSTCSYFQSLFFMRLPKHCIPEYLLIIIIVKKPCRISSHSAISISVRLGTDVGWYVLAYSLCSSSTQSRFMRLRSVLCFRKSGLSIRTSHFHGPGFVQDNIVMFEEGRAFIKLLPQSWKYIIV